MKFSKKLNSVLTADWLGHNRWQLGLLLLQQTVHHIEHHFSLVYTIQPVVKPVVKQWLFVQHGWTNSGCSFNTVVNRLYTTRFDNPFDNRLDVCLHDTAGCETGCTNSRLSNRLYNRFDNRLYRVNGVFELQPARHSNCLFCTLYVMYKTNGCYDVDVGLVHTLLARKLNTGSQVFIRLYTICFHVQCLQRYLNENGYRPYEVTTTRLIKIDNRPTV